MTTIVLKRYFLLFKESLLPALGAFNITKEGGMIMKHNFDKIIEILKYVIIILSLIVIIKLI